LHRRARPVPNRQAIEFVTRTALAMNCTISERTIFHRKNYPYPDLPKGYQISQYGDTPIGTNGWLMIPTPEGEKRISIRRVHLEEDTGKLFHVEDGTSLVDFNRSGVPLMEIVSEPDIRTPDEARAYLQELRAVLTYVAVSDCKMEEGSMRCEPNLSLRPVGSTELGTKTELKNLNSFRTVHKGLQYEIERQARVLSEGSAVAHETRRWDEPSGATALMRVKEYEDDYRYFPEPDLVPLHLDAAFVEAQRALLPELPHEKRERYVTEFGIPPYDAGVLAESRELAALYEETVASSADPKQASNWIMGEFLARLNADGIEIAQAKVGSSHISGLLRLIEDGTITGKIAKAVFDEMWKSGEMPAGIVEKHGLTQIDDAHALGGILDEVIAANPDVVEKIRGGKEKSIGFLVGEVMKRTKGRANPQLLNAELRKRILG
jgi:aspartyl-tRNA(Asn)/glutamyl-tRNA(Gln) amidotransferase subunit B